MCIRIIPRWSLTSSLHSLALRTEPICSRNKCREHQSVRGVRWLSRESRVQTGRKFESCPHIPQNCNLRKFVSLSQKLLRRFQWLKRSSAGKPGKYPKGRGQRWRVQFPHATIGCMLRQHPFHYASRSLRYRGAAFEEKNMEEKKKYCCTCKWYEIDVGVCVNGDSEYRADFRCLDDNCLEWTSKEENSCEKKI